MNTTLIIAKTRCFVNTANGAKASAILYSIAAAAQANGLNTEQYLTELFSQPAGTISLPFNTDIQRNRPTFAVSLFL